MREAQAAGRREQAALASLALKQGEVDRLLEELTTGAQLLHKVRPFSSPGFFRICLTFLSQCWGSVPFWCGSGSPDPYLSLMDPDPTLSSATLRRQNQIFFSYFVLRTYLQAYYLH